MYPQAAAHRKNAGVSADGHMPHCAVWPIPSSRATTCQLMPRNDLREFADFNRDFVADVQCPEEVGQERGGGGEDVGRARQVRQLPRAADILQANVRNIFRETI